jgi:hypothetical protein
VSPVDVNTRVERVLSVASLGRLRELIEGRPDAVLSLIGPDLTLLWASRPGSNGLYGREPDEVEGLHIRHLVITSQGDELVATLQRAFRGETAAIDVDAPDAAGIPVPVRVVAWPTQHDDTVLAITLPRRRPGQA